MRRKGKRSRCGIFCLHVLIITKLSSLGTYIGFMKYSHKIPFFFNFFLILFMTVTDREREREREAET